MDIEVLSDNEYEEWDDFDPISEAEKGQVKLLCKACVDGNVVINVDNASAGSKPVNLLCKVCSDTADIERAELVELLRNILINNIPVAGGEDSQVQLHPPF